MKALSVLVLIVAGLTLAPDPADADGGHRRFRGNAHGFRRFDGHHGHRHHHQHRGFLHRPVFPTFIGPSFAVASPVVVTPPVVYAPPPVYAGPPPPSYAPPAPPYAPPAAYAAPPPIPRVVEFPNGRYELRGDGTYSPYNWVWIPNPPTAPPVPSPPVAAPEPVPDRRPAVQTTVYRWTDERGVTTWTDDLEKVPERHRGQARRRP